MKLWSVFPKLFERFDFRRRPTVDFAGSGARLDRSPRRGRDLPARHRTGQRVPSGTRGAFSFRADPLRGRLDRDRCTAGPHRRQAAPHPARPSPRRSTTIEAATAATSTLSRRGLLRTTWLAAGVAVLGSAGASVPLLRKRLGVRGPVGAGPQDIPINKSAAAARVTAQATSAAYRLVVSNGDSAGRADRGANSRTMPQTTATLPIACVEGWSAVGDVDGSTGQRASGSRRRGGGRRCRGGVAAAVGPLSDHRVAASVRADDLTLLALDLNGEALASTMDFRAG